MPARKRKRTASTNRRFYAAVPPTWPSRPGRMSSHWSSRSAYRRIGRPLLRPTAHESDIADSGIPHACETRSVLRPIPVRSRVNLVSCPRLSRGRVLRGPGRGRAAIRKCSTRCVSYGTLATAPASHTPAPQKLAILNELAFRPLRAASLAGALLLSSCYPPVTLLFSTC